MLELRITAAGREALEEGRQRVEPVERRVVDALSPQKLDVLATLLTRWIKAIEAG